VFAGDLRLLLEVAPPHAASLVGESCTDEGRLFLVVRGGAFTHAPSRGRRRAAPSHPLAGGAAMFLRCSP
jgi:hypothetical protein